MDGSDHRVEVAGRLRHRLVWTVDERRLAERRTWLTRTRIRAHGVGRLHTAGHWVHLRTTGPTSNGVIEFTPEAGSRAARRRSELLHRPIRFAGRELLTAIAVIFVPLALVAGLVRLGSLLRQAGAEVPRAPSIPPSGFDLTDLGAPAWLQQLLDGSDYVTPLVIALVVIWSGLRHRRRLAELSDQSPDSARQPGRD